MGSGIPRSGACFRALDLDGFVARSEFAAGNPAAKDRARRERSARQPAAAPRTPRRQPKRLVPKPLKIVRGWRQYLYDETGPRVPRHVQQRAPGRTFASTCSSRGAGAAGLLNTNTRYLHEKSVALRGTAKSCCPIRSSVCYILNSGSEANELALRLARAYTGHDDTIVLERAYHGHTSTLIDISPYKFNGPGGSGKKPWVHVAPLADDYRGIYKGNDPQLGANTLPM